MCRHLVPGVVIVVLLALAGCRSTPEASLRVEDVEYTAEQTGRLTAEQVRTLADLTALGVAVSRDEAGDVVEPLAARAAERARVQHLPWLLAAQELDLDEEDLERLYGSAPEWELTVRHLVLLVPRWAAEEERRAARERAEEARRRVLGGEDFARVAGEYSEEPGAAERGGLLQPGREGTWVTPFWNAALALEPGGVSPVVETEYGYHVLRLEGRGPVPFGEADRGAVLRRVIPEAQAEATMQRWVVAREGAVEADREAILDARRLLESGEAADSLVLASWPGASGDGAAEHYTARDLALFRASLDGESVARLDRETDDGFVGRVVSDAEAASWAREAERLGAPAPTRAAEEVRLQWQARGARWAEGLGFRRGSSAEQIGSAALRALAARGQEAQIARMELVGLRPLLRERYRAEGTALPSPAASSNSPTR